MKSRARSLATLVGAALQGACGSSPGSTSLDLPRGSVAQVGDAPVEGATVAALVSSGASPDRALAALVEDALASQPAHTARIEPGWTRTVAQARQVLRHAESQARASGPSTPQELARVVVVHALVRRAPGLAEIAARTAAETLAAAVAPAHDVEGFERAARAVPASGARIVVERLAPIDPSGHTDDGSELDPTFASAALALRNPGDTSAIVETPFGWHVLRLLERIVPEGGALELARARFEPAIVTLRVRGALAEVLRVRRARTSIETSSDVDRLLAVVGGT